ncbi:MAG TPA: long-chain-fatty-acid--CoA ligase [Syntrophobacteraceae bacterium]|nr:long-chain-fatty-acid--CoA ligase [Syntrophobacteraceae bacterium]
MNLVAMLDMNARKFADKDCLRYNGKSFSYRALKETAERGAAVLQSRGVRKNDKIALMSQNTPSFVFAFYAVMKAGAVAVPINHKLMPPEVQYILDHSDSKLIFFDGSLVPVVSKVSTTAVKVAMDSAAEGFERFESLLEKAREFVPVEVFDEDLAEILYTSGTTGKPKGCLHTQRSVIMAAATGALAVKLDRHDRLLMAMPIWHSSPLNNWFMGTQYVGGVTVMIREYHPLHFLKAVQDEKCTVYFGAPVSYILPIKTVPQFSEFDLTSMRCWIYGGGPMAADTALMVMKTYKSDNFYQVYGMTEAGPTGTVLFPDEQVHKAGSIGNMALPGADMITVRIDGRQAGPGDVGEICLRADSMMKGYFKDDAATREAFKAGWYHTGDLARIDEDGYLFIVDRIKDMIVTGGENVYSREVEDAIATCPGVMEAAVVGLPDPDWGEIVTAFVVPHKDQQADPDTIKAFLADKLAKFKIPRVIHLVDSLPHTPSGKVMKFELRERFR